MIIAQHGKVTEKITLLGRKESCLYMIRSQDESVVLGGGLAYVVPDLIAQLDSMQMDERQISRICILHAHFDHCGAVPYLKQRWPWATVTASVRAKDLLSKPQVMQGIIAMNQKSISDAGCQQAFVQSGAPLNDIHVEETVKEGDVIRCGDVDLIVLEVPGHSSCSIALYMPAEKALFASDAIGLKSGDHYQPTPNSNFDQFQQSLEKMARYQSDIILLEHFGAFVGDDARTLIPEAIKATADVRQMIEQIYLKTRNVEACTREVTEILLQRSADAFLPEEVRVIVAGQMVRFIAKSIEAKQDRGY